MRFAAPGPRRPFVARSRPEARPPGGSGGGIDLWGAIVHPLAMPATFADLYAELSPTARRLAQAYGVAAPYPMGVTATYYMLADAGIGAPGLQRRINQADIRNCGREVIAAGLAMCARHALCLE